MGYFPHRLHSLPAIVQTICNLPVPAAWADIGEVGREIWLLGAGFSAGYEEDTHRGLGWIARCGGCGITLAIRDLDGVELYANGAEYGGISLGGHDTWLSMGLQFPGGSGDRIFHFHPPNSSQKLAYT